MDILQQYASRVQAMRQKQIEYFAVAMLCKKDPSMHTKRKAVLEESILLEEEVDKLTEEALKKPAQS
jgi:hypothetical protein